MINFAIILAHILTGNFIRIASPTDNVFLLQLTKNIEIVVDSHL